MPPRKALVPLLLLAAAALAGCIDEPRPFRPLTKPLPAQIGDPALKAPVVAVTPVAGLPPSLGRLLADAMAQSLAKRNLLVAVGDGGRRRVIYSVGGRFVAPPPEAELTMQPSVIWEVRGEHGELVARYSQRLPILGDLAAPVTRARFLAELAREPAETVVKGIEGDAPVPSDGTAAAALAENAARAAGRGRSLLVAAIKGAPSGDGDVALRRTIEYALKVANVRVVEKKAADSLLLDGTVATSRLDEDHQHVKVSWTVKRQDGQVVGEVSQENNVPTRILERVWGEIASAVAQNAAGGIAALVAQADAPKVK